MLESIEKLRDYMEQHDPVNDKSDEMIRAATLDALEDYVDAIESEISERYMLLPVDVDGVVWKHTDNTFISDDGYEHTLVTMSVDRAGKWILSSYGTCYQASKCRHVKPRTVEDILRDFLNDHFKWDAASDYDLAEAEYNDKKIKRYAAELRELLGGEEYAETVRHVKPDSLEELLDDVSKGVICYPRERVTGYLEDNHSIGEAVMLDVRDRLRDLLGGDA